MRRSAQKAAQEAQRAPRAREGRARPARVMQQRELAEVRRMEHELQQRATIATMGLGDGVAVLVGTLRCTMVLSPGDQTLWYIACPYCGYKLSGATEYELEGECELCRQTRYGRRRWVLPATVCDATGSCSVTLLNYTAVMLLGKTADEMAAIRMRDAAAFKAHLSLCSHKQWLASGVVCETCPTDLSVDQLTPIDFCHEGRILLWEIARMRT